MAKKLAYEKPANIGYNIKQQRSMKTYNALIIAGMRLLEKHSFESITVAHLASESGYSVGAFYARFRSKDEYFDSLLQHHIDRRLEANKRLLETCTPDNAVDRLFTDLVKYYCAHRNFWRATIIRNSPDPAYWQPLRQLGKQNAVRFVDYVEQVRGRSLDEAEKTNILFAFQATRSIINNTIINNPGPFSLDQKKFLEHLIRAFYLISDYHNLVRPAQALR
jgi:AcrR family transcriptional regulator